MFLSILSIICSTHVPRITAIFSNTQWTPPWTNSGRPERLSEKERRRVSDNQPDLASLTSNLATPYIQSPFTDSAASEHRTIVV